MYNYKNFLRALTDKQLEIEFSRTVREDSNRNDYVKRCKACENEIEWRGLPI